MIPHNGSQVAPKPGSNRALSFFQKRLIFLTSYFCRSDIPSSRWTGYSRHQKVWFILVSRPPPPPRELRALPLSSIGDNNLSVIWLTSEIANGFLRHSHKIGHQIYISSIHHDTSYISEKMVWTVRAYI
jgi:hypothetical protein